jgi:hypothetical protein
MQNRRPNKAQLFADNRQMTTEALTRPKLIEFTAVIPCVRQGSAVNFARLRDTQSRGETSLIDANALHDDK